MKQTNTSTPPPESIAEQSLLGCLLINSHLCRRVQAHEDDFSSPINRRIFKAIYELHEDGMVADMVSVCTHMGVNGRDAAYISGLSEHIMGDTAAWQTYDQQVREFSAKRQLAQLARVIEKKALNGAGPQEIIDLLHSRSTELRKKIEGTKKSLASEIKEWCLLTSGNFLITDIYRDFGLITTTNKQAAIMAVQRLEKDGVLTKCGTKRGCYRTIDTSAPEIDYLSADISNILNISWPFELESLVNIYPKNIIILAGESNAGKTAFLLNVALLNQDRHRIIYYTSEMGPEELKLRLSKFEHPIDEWHCKFRERASDWPDVIHADAINIIDYLEITDDFFAIGGIIRSIWERLGKGIAIIALQKKKGQELARGGDFTLEKARLYLSMAPGELHVVKAKNWAKHGVNPNNKRIKFKLINGSKFVDMDFFK